MSKHVDECHYTLTGGKRVKFINYSLKQPRLVHESSSHKIPQNLEPCLSNPCDLSYSPKAAFLGWGSATPTELTSCGSSSLPCLYPVWMPLEWLLSSNQLNLLIAGQTGSGKTSLLYRIIAASLRDVGSVVIGEVKRGAFSDFSDYLSQFFGVKSYRWPNGNCWFNPLLKLRTLEQRRVFADALLNALEIEDEGFAPYVEKVSGIVSTIIDLQLMLASVLEKGKDIATIKELAVFLGSHKKTAELLDSLEKSVSSKELRRYLNDVKTRLESLDFFRQDHEHYMNTRLVIVRLVNTLKSSFSFLEYTQPPNQSANWIELDIKKHLIEERAILTVSQPLEEPISASLAGLIWDLIYDEIIPLGSKQNRPQTQNLVCFIDEAAKLSSGKLGNATDILRSYGVSIVEVYPLLESDKHSEAFNRRIQTFGTFLSLHPALDPLAKYLFDHRRVGQNECLTIVPRLSHDFEMHLDVETPNTHDAMPQDFKQTGERTLLLHNKIKAETFWVDINCPLMACIEDLLLEFRNTQKKVVFKLVAYALGLITEIP